MDSELTVTPDSDTTYTCTVTDPLGNKADPKTADLKVFGTLILTVQCAFVIIKLRFELL